MGSLGVATVEVLEVVVEVEVSDGSEPPDDGMLDD
jgi:hypothetical protein